MGQWVLINEDAYEVPLLEIGRRAASAALAVSLEGTVDLIEINLTEGNTVRAKRMT